VRELALPFVLLWAAFAASQRRWRECLAVLAVIALFAVGMAFHAQAVIAERLPHDLNSQGWTGLQGLPLALFGVAFAGRLVTALVDGTTPQFWLPMLAEAATVIVTWLASRHLPHQAVGEGH
jgi:RsiW-degrading membrane proteinase PrsW (M82 family)